MEATIREQVAIPDEEYSRILFKVEKSQHKIFNTQDKNGVPHSFYYKDDKLVVDVGADDKLINKDVMKLSDAMKIQKDMTDREKEDYRKHIRQVVKDDNPHLPDESLDAYADVLTAANQTIKNLMKKGHSPDEAFKIVSAILEIKDAYELNAKIAEMGENAQAILKQYREEQEEMKEWESAQSAGARQRESILGRPGDPSYGPD